MAEVIAPGLLQSAQTGNGDSTNTILDTNVARPSTVRIVSTVGATPTVTINIRGSVDGLSYYNIPFALVTAPSSFVLTAIVITTAATNFYLLQTNQSWNYCKLVMTANTNVTLTSFYF